MHTYHSPDNTDDPLSAGPAGSAAGYPFHVAGYAMAQPTLRAEAAAEAYFLEASAYAAYAQVAYAHTAVAYEPGPAVRGAPAHPASFVGEWPAGVSLRREPAPHAGSILAVIPTAGRERDRLYRCLDALYAASQGVRINPVVVVCPTDPATVDAVRYTVGGRAAVVALPGPFNYPRSVNVGLAQRSLQDGYALLLNDDCFFSQPDALHRLVTTLRAERWACVGPWIRGREAPPESWRPDGPRRAAGPIVGTAVLWSFEWLDRTGPFDETFGIGWGQDECDQCLRALRLGAAWGQDGRVLAEHLYHATFGDAAVAPDGEPFRRNVAAWQAKYPGVHTWGGSRHWQPLPGVHVAVAGHNVAPWLKRALESVEQALDGFRWVMTYADDGSTDGSLEVALDHRSGADRYEARGFPKGAGPAEAKNRAVEMGRQWSAEYPVLCLMDADDEMTPARVRHLLWRMRDGEHAAVFGDYQIVARNSPHDGELGPATAARQAGCCIHPCSTLIHWSLVPKDGKLFDESLPIMEDADLWLRWHLRGIRMVPLPGAVVHRWRWRTGSVMRSPDSARRMAAWHRRKEALLSGALHP
jgi:hypothetical protein